MTRLRADLLLLLAAFIWGTAFIAQKYANDTMGPLQFVGARFLVSALLLAPLAWREARREPIRPTRRDLGLAGLVGLCLFGALATQQVGLTMTTVTNAGFLTSLYIALVPFVAWLLARTPVRPMILGACAVSLAGAWLLASHGQAAHLTAGDLLIVGSALITAFHISLISIFLRRTHRPFLLCLVQYALTAAAALVLGALVEPVRWPGIAAAVPSILYAGVLSGAVGFTLQIVAQRHTPAAEAALIMSLESVFAAVAAGVILGERLSPLALAGCGLILAGVVMVEVGPAWGRRRAAPVVTHLAQIGDDPAGTTEGCTP